jgi:glycerol transport system ATP-binding protein
VLVLDDVSFRDGNEFHIHPTSISLEPGVVHALLGETLAGKTTLLRLMAGLTQPTTGRILFDTHEVTGQAVQKRRVSMVYQQFINYPHLSVRDNIASPLKVAGFPATEVQTRVNEVATLLRLEPYLDRRPSQLSGGQQQRTALARALVKDSKLVLLDEPFANLDYKLREALRDELPRLLAGRGAVVVYATTEPAEALQLGGNIAALHEGRLCQFGRSSEVYRQPTDITTAQILSEPPMNLVRAQLREGRIFLSSSLSWPLPEALRHRADPGFWVGMRPHHLSPGGHGAPVQVRGRVLISVVSGSESIIRFEHEQQSWVCACPGLVRIASGENAHFGIDIDRAMYFGLDGKRIAIPPAATIAQAGTPTVAGVLPAR